MSEKFDKNMNHSYRLMCVRRAKKQVKKMIDEGRSTKETFEVKKVFPAKKINGKNYYEVCWKNTLEEPANLYGCVDLMGMTVPEFQNKSSEEIMNALYRKQCENDGEQPSFKDKIEEDMNDEQIQKEIEEINEELKGETKGARGK